MSDNVIKIKNLGVMHIMFIFKCIIYFFVIVALTGVIAYHWPKNFLGIPGMLIIAYFGRKFLYNIVIPDTGGDEININLTRGLIEADNMIVPFNAISDISTKRFIEGNLFWTYYFTKGLGLNWNFKTNVVINLKDGTTRELFIGNLYDASRFINTMRRIVPVHSS